MAPLSVPQLYLVHVAVFAGGFLAAHALLWRSRVKRLIDCSRDTKDSRDSKQDEALQGCRKQDSTLTDSSATAPETPAATEPKLHVSFQGFADERPVESKERQGNANGKERQENLNGSQQVSALTQANVSAFAAHKDGAQVQGRAAGAAPSALHQGVLPPAPSPNLHDLSDTESVGSGSGSGNGTSHNLLTRACSGIPTDIQILDMVFGAQVPHSTVHTRPPVLPFSTYAPCRLLDVLPDNPEKGQIFEGIRTIAAYYLRADSPSICDCIQTFNLNDLLFSIARLECTFKSKLRGNQRQKSALSSAGRSAQTEALIARAAEQALQQRLAPQGAEEMEAVRGVVAALMHELECILHEYLSFNWDRVDEIYEANKHLLREEGLVCAWKSTASLASLPSTPSIAGLSPRWDMDTSASRSMSNLSEMDQASSPGSEDSLYSTYETFDQYMANLNNGGDSQRPSVDMIRSSHEGSPASRLHDAVTAVLENDARTRSSAAAETSGRENGNGNDARSSRGDEDGRPRRKAASAKRALNNWKRAKLAVTRKITEEMLGPQRRFLTLRQMFEELSHGSQHGSESGGRQPIILLLGGGMAAGKSTVREIIGHDGFWSKVAKDAVVVEADAIKNRDVLYRSLSRMDFFHDDDNLRQHLHEYSTKAAEALLVAAVNQQKDVVFDGTMTWAPFVQQTIAMVRDHRHNYRRGPGFQVDEEGNTYERYWEIDKDTSVDVSKKVPYRIELVGVTCDTGLAVARGIWRKIRTGRSVPVPSQLRSHRLFAENFEQFTSLVDSATLYHTGSALTTFNKGGVDLSPKVIAHRSSYTRGELLINPPAYKSFRQKACISDQATCRHDLYDNQGPCDGKVPTTDEDQMSTLRHVFRAADRRERRTLRREGMPRTNSVW